MTSSKPTATGTDIADVREAVRLGYTVIAQGGCCSPSGMDADGGASRAAGTTSAGGGCCGATSFEPAALAKAIGYSPQELAGLPEGANLGLSCGNPTALASLRQGEVVLDLGSGGGFDCFIAGPRVGAAGRVIGVDMTAAMLQSARRNLLAYRTRTGLDNIEFRLGEIEALPVADSSVDVVISNCVLNLSEDKPRVWREIARVLRPGGRIAVSDLALLKALPAEVVADVYALIGCVAGAVLVADLYAQATDAGLLDVQVECKPQYIDAMTDWNDPLYRNIVARLPAGSRASDYITSVNITARKREHS